MRLDSAVGVAGVNEARLAAALTGPVDKGGERAGSLVRYPAYGSTGECGPEPATVECVDVRTGTCQGLAVGVSPSLISRMDFPFPLGRNGLGCRVRSTNVVELPLGKGIQSGPSDWLTPVLPPLLVVCNVLMLGQLSSPVSCARASESSERWVEWVELSSKLSFEGCDGGG